MDLRAMSVGIMRRPAARQSKRYWGREFPEYGSLARTTWKRCIQVLEKENKGLETIDVEEWQQCLLVACQVLMPPMRGKPFWTMSLQDDQMNSVPLLPKVKYLLRLVHRLPCRAWRWPFLLRAWSKNNGDAWISAPQATKPYQRNDTLLGGGLKAQSSRPLTRGTSHGLLQHNKW